MLNFFFIFEKAFSLISDEMEQKILYFSERMNIVYMKNHREYFRILPNHTNYTWTYWKSSNFSKKFKLLNSYLMSVFYAQKNNYWSLADKFLEELHLYQRIYGKSFYFSSKN